MIALLFEVLAWVLLSAGALFTLIGGIGVLRFPDVFTRMHAASVCETLGTFSILLGLCCLGGGWIMVAKLLLILLFLGLTNPTSAHALAKAALHDGLRPPVGTRLGKDGE